MNDLQESVRKFCIKYNLSMPLDARLLDLSSEVGEVAKEYLVMTSYGSHEPEISKKFALELGDVLYTLITIANSCEINLKSELDSVLIKYEKRLERGSPGSEND